MLLSEQTRDLLILSAQLDPTVTDSSSSSQNPTTVVAWGGPPPGGAMPEKAKPAPRYPNAVVARARGSWGYVGTEEEITYPGWTLPISTPVMDSSRYGDHPRLGRVHRTSVGAWNHGGNTIFSLPWHDSSFLPKLQALDDRASYTRGEDRGRSVPTTRELRLGSFGSARGSGVGDNPDRGGPCVRHPGERGGSGSGWREDPTCRHHPTRMGRRSGDLRWHGPMSQCRRSGHTRLAGTRDGEISLGLR
jgi:hypothetical protein